MKQQIYAREIFISLSPPQRGNNEYALFHAKFATIIQYRVIKR